jgi:hypothetical protein
MFHRPLYWRSKRNSPQDVHHINFAGTRVHARRSERRAKFGVAGESLGSSMSKSLTLMETISLDEAPHDLRPKELLACFKISLPKQG